jgi:hypothetical protein
MQAVAGILGLALLAAIVADAFQTVVVARRGQTIARLTRLLLQGGWSLFARAARTLCPDRQQEMCLGVYGPLSLLMLLGAWAGGLIVAFAALQWAAEPAIPASLSGFADALYFSAGTFFTLGTGAPGTSLARALMVLEAGAGFSFLGLVVGYLPVLYQSYSSRELRILLLDARAGSPPSAAEFLVRAGDWPDRLEARLADWEEWALDLLQGHLSYPMLAYYRSQHTNQSWLAALTTMVDASALLMLEAEGALREQAGFTYAVGRHALVHTAAVFRARPAASAPDRLSAADFSRLRAVLAENRTRLRPDRIAEEALAKLRAMYEPYAEALGAAFLLAVPAWAPDDAVVANWQLSSWER